MAGASDFSIVLVGRFAGKDRSVAQAISRCFGRDDSWGLHVVLASPIILLTNLNVDQASAIADALHDVEHAGSKLEIQQGIDEGLPQLQWPAQPRIRGRQLSDFGPPPAAHNVLLIVPCPYTQQKIQLTLNITYGKSTDGNPVPNITATTAPYKGNAPVNPSTPINPISTNPAIPAIPGPAVHPPIALNRPMTPAAPRPAITLPPPIPLPGASNPVAKTTPNSGLPAQIPAPLPLPSHSAPQPPATPKPLVIDGLDALDELAPMDQIKTPPSLMIPASAKNKASGGIPRPASNNAQQAPAPLPARPPAPPPVPPPLPKPVTVTFSAKPNTPAPLPDIPVLHNAPPPEKPAQPAPMTLTDAMPMPSSMMGAPMDLSAFEASVTGSGLTAALSEEQAQELINAEASGEAQTADDGSLYSVSIGKTNNAKAHQLVAEVLGVPATDAARICQKPIVSLAKEVSHSQALDIKQKFASSNIQVRLQKKR